MPSVKMSLTGKLTDGIRLYKVYVVYVKGMPKHSNVLDSLKPKCLKEASKVEFS